VKVRDRVAKRAWLALEDENMERVVTEAVTEMVTRHLEMIALMFSAPLAARIAGTRRLRTVLVQ